MSSSFKSLNQFVSLRAGVSLFLAAITALVMLASRRPAYGSGQDWDKLNRFVQTSNSSDAAIKAISEGRDLIENEKWVKAAEKFNEVLNRYPKDKNVDAALYWLAFTLKKQEKFQEANQQLARLIKEFPQSRWNDDAKAMQIELANRVGNQTVVDDAIQKNNNDELRLIALQSLFQVDPERAAPLASNLLKPDSKASKDVKETALSLLGRYGGKQVFALLVEVARNESESDALRESAIYWMAQQGGEQAFESLVQLYDTGKNDGLKDRILYWFAQSKDQRANAKIIEIARADSSTYLRERAIYWIAQQGATDTLVQLYGTEKNQDLKDRLIYWFAQSKDQRAQEKVVEIARTDSSQDLRERAIYWIAQRDAVETLIQLYDAEKSDDLKERIIYWFAQSKKRPALQKLMEIARSSPSQNLKERAFYWLGQSKDPEVLKFFESIIK